jgi:autotransporter-associated beta strand protein
LAGGPVFAADYYNYGVDGSRIGNATNYSNTNGSTTNATANPGASDNLFFFNSTAGAGPLDRRLEVGASNLSFNSMTFLSNAGAIQFDRGSTGSSSAVVVSIGAGGLTLDAGAGPVTFGRLADGGNEQRVIVGAIADFSINNNSANDLTFVREFDGRLNNTTNVITVAGSGSGNTVFAGGIKANDTGRDLAMVINTTGSGAVRIEGTGSYTGGTTLQQGTLQVRGSSALGTGALTINGGTLASIISPRTLTNTVTVGGNFTLGGSGHAITLNGTMDLGGGTRIITTANAANFGGVISNGGITKQGVAALTLSGNNTYTGATTVSAGALIVDGTNSSATTVQSGALLGGSGSVASAVIQSGGTISPGNSPGTLTLTNGLTFEGGGNYDWQIFAAIGTPGQTDTWDLLDVTGGTWDITGLSSTNKFNINLWSLSGLPDTTGVVAGFDAASNYSWKILGSVGLTGTFSSDLFSINTAATNGTGGFIGATGMFALELNNDDLFLTYTGSGAPIPEPGTWAAAGLLALAAGYTRWRRRMRKSP